MPFPRLDALDQAPGGLRSEDLQRLLKVDKSPIRRPLFQAGVARMISKKRESVSTRYFVK